MKRWMIIGGVALTLALTGCSKSEPTATSPTTSKAANGDTPTTKSGAPTATLNMNDCVAVASANLGIIGGSASDAEKLKKYNPPDDVAKAADLIVAKGGIKIDASDQSDVLAASDKLTEWMKAICPNT